MPKHIGSDIIPARFIALDSSILGHLATDYFASDAATRKNSKNFLGCLGDNGFIPLLCWHHFEELIKHRDDEVVKDRFDFLRTLPQVAWVPVTDGDGFGSIVDLLVAECRAALHGGEMSAREVRDQTRNSLIRFGTGAEAVAPYEELWPYLQPSLWEYEERVREIVAISRTEEVIDISKVPLSSFMNGAVRARPDAIKLLSQFQAKMAQEIQRCGDKRIPNPSIVASQFYGRITDESDIFYTNVDGIQRYLNILEVDIDELGPNALMGDVMKLAEFRKKLKVAHRAFRIPWEFFKKSIKPEQIPSWIIESSLRTYAQKQTEHKGSELNDRHLACLAPYADLIYVDKRVKEDFKRASQKNSVLRGLLNQVERVRPYNRLQEQIEAIDIKRR